LSIFSNSYTAPYIQENFNCCQPTFYYRITPGTAVRGKSCEFIGMEVQREGPIWAGDMRQSGWISGKLKKLSVRL